MQLRRTLSLTVIAALAFLIVACTPDYGVAVRNLTSKTKPRPNRLPCHQRSGESHSYSVRTMASPDRFSIE